MDGVQLGHQPADEGPVLGGSTRAISATAGHGSGQPPTGAITSISGRVFAGPANEPLQHLGQRGGSDSGGAGIEAPGRVEGGHDQAGGGEVCGDGESSDPLDVAHHPQGDVAVAGFAQRVGGDEPVQTRGLEVAVEAVLAGRPGHPEVAQVAGAGDFCSQPGQDAAVTLVGADDGAVAAPLGEFAAAAHGAQALVEPVLDGGCQPVDLLAGEQRDGGPGGVLVPGAFVTATGVGQAPFDGGLVDESAGGSGDVTGHGEAPGLLHADAEEARGFLDGDEPVDG